MIHGEKEEARTGEAAEPVKCLQILLFTTALVGDRVKNGQQQYNDEIGQAEYII